MIGIAFFLLLVSFSALYAQPVTLRDTTNQYDYIVITVPEFVNACEPFRQHKETVRGFSTLIVDTTQIFAEFDTSAAPQDNIRNFISYAGTFWKEPRPKFFLIAGTVQMVPNFQIPFPTPPAVFYQSDYYYWQNIYENDTTTTDFYIGRIPNRDTIELNDYLSKVIEYEANTTLYGWMNNNLFICENDPVFEFYENAVLIADDYLPDFTRSFYIVDDSNSIYYGNKDSIYKTINERGCAVSWFYGHCNDSAFISPEFFSINDLSGFNNQEMYFLSIFVSTQHSIQDTNTNMSAKMMMMSESGSLGGLVSVGPSYWGVGNAMRENYAQRLFDPTIHSIGEAFTLDNLVPNSGLYNYMLKTTNLWADPSLQLKYDVTVGITEGLNAEVPEQFTLYQNYPNPFNPSTKIKYTIPGVIASETKQSQLVTLKVYDVLGNEMATLVNEEKPVGTYEIEFNASNLTSGIYFYQLKAGSFIETKKMVLLR